MEEKYKIKEISENKKLIENGKDLDPLEAMYLAFNNVKDTELFGFIAFGEDLLVTRYRSELLEGFLKKTDKG